MPDPLDVYKAALGHAARVLAATDHCPEGWSPSHPDCNRSHPDSDAATHIEACEECWWDVLREYGELRVLRMQPPQNGEADDNEGWR